MTNYPPPLLRGEEIPSVLQPACHGGAGSLTGTPFLGALTGRTLAFAQDALLPAGASIGCHTHHTNEEFYYLLAGQGELTFDGERFAVQAGDFCFCPVGHSHGLLAVEDCRLLIVGGAAIED